MDEKRELNEQALESVNGGSGSTDEARCRASCGWADTCGKIGGWDGCADYIHNLDLIFCRRFCAKSDGCGKIGHSVRCPDFAAKPSKSI